jgi:uncharacterized damage-inducible protein DinB
MDRFIQQYLERLESLHGEIAALAKALPQEALDWTPGPETNSLAILAVHIAGAERYWFSDVIAGEPSGRVRETEFQTRGMNAVELEQRLASALTTCRTVLGSVPMAELSGERTSPRDGQVVTVGWILLHILEHTATHLGHIQLTSQLWKQRV